MPLNTSIQIGSDARALLESQIATVQKQTFMSKARILNLNIPIVRNLNGNVKDVTEHFEGFGTGTLDNKPKGEKRATSTTPKIRITIGRDEPEYYTEEFDWFDSNVFPTWDVMRNAATRGTEKYVVKAETRLTALLAKAAGGSASSGVHLGGNNVVITGAGGTDAACVSAAVPDSSAGADTFLAAAHQINETFMVRREQIGMNGVCLVDPYITQRVLLNSAKYTSRDYNAAGSIPGATVGPTIAGYPVVETPYLRLIRGVYSADNVARYNGDFSRASSTTPGIPLALFINFDSMYSPLMTVRHMAPQTQVWYETDEDVNKAGIKSLEGHDILCSWCAGGIFAHN